MRERLSMSKEINTNYYLEYFESRMEIDEKKITKQKILIVTRTCDCTRYNPVTKCTIYKFLHGTKIILYAQDED